MVRTYSVLCSILGTDGEYTKPLTRTVAVGDTSKRRTTFADIPKIIALATGSSVDRVKILKAILVGEEE